MAWYMPRFWHGMRFSAWMRELRRNRFAIAPQKLPMALTITLTAALNSAFTRYEARVFRRRLGRTEVEPPIFILGHWRSGTTYLQELMACDPAHSFPTTYRCFVPGHFLISERAIKSPMRRLLPPRRPMDDVEVGWDQPMEDEFALMNLGIPSPYLSMMFPSRGEKDLEYLTLQNVPPADRERWKEAMVRVCKLLTLADGRRLVFKSPTHTARIRTLLEIFPDAKFIHIAREPEAIYRSAVHFWKTMVEEVGLEGPTDTSWTHDRVIRWFRLMYDAYFADRGLLGPSQLVELRYEDLVVDPKGELRRAYEQLNLGPFARLEPALDAFLSAREYRTNEHRREPGLDAELRARWGDYFEAFGY